MRRWRYTLLTAFLVLVALFLRHSPASGAGEEPTPEPAPQEEFVPTEKLPADAAISFPVDI